MPKWGIGDKSQILGCKGGLQYTFVLQQPAAIQKYRNELAVFKERERGHPKAPMTLRQAHKNDCSVERRTANTARRSGESDAKMKSRIATRFSRRHFSGREVWKSMSVW